MAVGGGVVQAAAVASVVQATAVLLGVAVSLAAAALLLVAVGPGGSDAAQAAVKYTKAADKTALNS